jgi:uncharacterized protein (TIGR02246 family)
MPQQFTTPQDVEDTFYDAIEAKDLEGLMEVWEGSDDVACLLPMQPLVQGRKDLAAAWGAMLSGDFGVDIEVLHLRWLELGDIAIHYLQERVKLTAQTQLQPPVYATNIYRRGSEGWRLILHQNSPAPPPPGMLAPGSGLGRPGLMLT